MKMFNKSVEKLYYLPMSQHLNKKIHKGHKLSKYIPGNLRSNANSKNTILSVYLKDIIFSFLFIKPRE